jgi:hypothetical protein
VAVLKRAAAELTTGAHLMATRYHYYLRDGFSLCHVRRNTLIARAVLELETVHTCQLPPPRHGDGSPASSNVCLDPVEANSRICRRRASRS